jgi:Skp family chaperone for outer membrane proteins
MTRKHVWKLTILTAFLLAAPLLAQTRPPAQVPPPQNPPAQAPPLIPTLPKPGTPAPKATVPFPADAKIAYINLQDVFGDSTLGKQGLDRMKALSDRIDAGLSAREKEIQGLSERIKTQQGVVNQQVVANWNRDLQRLQREAQFAQQEAQVEISQLQQEVLESFQARVRPVVEAIRAEKGLWIVFAVEGEAGGLSIVAAQPGVDLSAEVVKRLNATSAS